MNARRSFVVFVPVLLLSWRNGFMSANAGEVLREKVDEGGQGGHVSFSKEVFVDFSGGKSWSIRGRLIALGKGRKEVIPVYIEVATDPSFSQVVHRESVAAKRDVNYSFRYVYQNEYESVELYVRFILRGVGAHSNAGSVLEGGDILVGEAVKISPWDVGRQ